MEDAAGGDEGMILGWIAVVAIGLLAVTLLAALVDLALDVVHYVRLWMRDRR